MKNKLLKYEKPSISLSLSLHSLINEVSATLEDKLIFSFDSEKKQIYMFKPWFI